jgi:hypothetical protein
MPRYYDAIAHSGERYSYRGSIKSPRFVPNGGYISFGNPENDHWYILSVDEKGKVSMDDADEYRASETNAPLREWIDGKTRELLKGRLVSRKRKKAGPRKPSLGQIRRAAALRESIERRK